MSASRTTLGGRRLLLMVTLGVAAFALFFPARQLLDQRGDIDELEGRLSALVQENERLEREVARLSDPAELEVQARERLGLVRPGERAYVIEPTEASEQPAGEVKARSLFDRAWDWITSLVRGGG